MPLASFPYPPHSTDVHHEVELVVALKSGGTNIPVAKALDHVWGYAVALDMTRRDLQNEAKKLGRPWEIGKAFERSGPVGPLKPVSEVGHPAQGRVELKVNGALKQEGDLNQMIWKVPEMIAYLSEYFELASRRCHHVRNAFGGWSGGAWRYHGSPDRRLGFAHRQGRLTVRKTALQGRFPAVFQNSHCPSVVWTSGAAPDKRRADITMGSET